MAGSSASGLDELLKQLQSLPSGATAAQAVELFREPRTQTLERARALAALPRVLTPDVYARLVQDLAGAPDLDSLVAAYPHDFERVPPDAWEMRASTREHLLAGWQRREAEWRGWNGILYDALLAKAAAGVGPGRIPDKPSEIEAVYHGAASAAPDLAIPSFEQAYARADERADFAHCQALLDAVRGQERYRGSRFSQSYRDRARYLQSRLLFIDALQKTHAYLKRTEPHREFDAVVHRQTPAPWIFHMHATGGLGKTMFLRWNVARNLVLRRIPCAYVDFDEHALLTFVRHPLRLLGLVMTQWTQQMTHTVFASAASTLQRSQMHEGWDPGVLADLELMLKGANVQSELVVVLDTLEEPTLTQPDWLRHVIATLGMLHAHLPRMTLVLAGRYPLTGMLDPSEAVVYELPLFTRTEAASYLALRGVADVELQAAIVERALAEDRLATAAAATLNPFKLALMTELVLDQDGLTPDQIRALPDVDIAYLIERVILRIASQPLRWIIRYGAICRRLTVPFLTDVLLPPLRAALRGQSTDLQARHLSAGVRTYLDSKVTWQPDPALADSLQPQTLWDELAVFARERGWISVITDEGGESALQLHPDVVRPVQALLSDEPVYRDLHEAALAFSVARWSEATLPWPQRAAAATDAIFHTSVLDPVEARVLWRRLLADADPGVRYVIAAEPTGPAYRTIAVREAPDGSTRDEERPRHPDWYAEAHVESARVRLRSAGVAPASDSESWASCRIHIAAARAVQPEAVPALLVSLDDAAAQAVTAPGAAAESLGRVAPMLPEAERFWLHVHAARYWTLAANEARAETQWIDAARLAPAANVSGQDRAQIDLQLAALYGGQQRYRDAMDAYDRVDALGLASGLLDQALVDEARLALSHYDVERYRRVLVAVPTPRPHAFELLELGRLVQAADTRAFFERVDRVRAASTRAEDHAAIYVLEGDAHRWLLNYREALEAYSRAADVSADQPGERPSASRVRELELYAFDMQDLSNAWRYLSEWGSADPRFEADARVRIVRAYLELRAGMTDKPRADVESMVQRGRPVQRGRMLLMALALGSPADQPSWLAALSAALDAVEPAQMLVDVLRILEPLPARPLPDVYARVLSAVRTKALHGPDVPLEWPLQLLDLARVCQAEAGEIERHLRAALETLPRDRSVARLWYGMRLLDHYRAFSRPAPLMYGDLLAECPSSEATGTPLEAALQARTASERLAAGDLAGAQSLADRAGQEWTQQPDSRHLRDVTRLRADVAQAAARAQAALERAAMARTGNATPDAARAPLPKAPRVVRGGRTRPAAPERPPAAPASVPSPAPVPSPPDAPDLERVVLTEPMLWELDSHLDKLSTRGVTAALFNDWRSVERLMTAAVLRATGGRTPVSVQIAAGWREAALPWEFAAQSLGVRLMCRGPSERVNLRPSGTDDRRAILVVKAGGGDAYEGLSFAVGDEAASGFSIEDIYGRAVPDAGVEVLRTPHPDELGRMLTSHRPSVVHIVGQLLESTSGVLIDFQGADSRLRKQSTGTGVSGATLDARRFARYAYQHPPLVVLDITAPENVTDVVRMLLLRNRFAAELLESGGCRGVLATGLTAAHEREAFAHRLVRPVADNATLADFWTSLRAAEAPSDLEALLSGHSTALFAHNPFRRVFSGPDEPR